MQMQGLEFLTHNVVSYTSSQNDYSYGSFEELQFGQDTTENGKSLVDVSESGFVGPGA